MKKNKIEIFTVLLCIFFGCLNVTGLAQKQKKQTTIVLPVVPTGEQDREYVTNLLYRIAYPIVHNMAEGTLRKNLPLEKGPGYYLNVLKVTHMEAVGRTMAGIAPWLALPDDDTKEGVMRKQLREELLKGLPNIVNPDHPDYLNFRTE